MSVHQSSKIKVIHISTGYNGGAALAARRLNESLNTAGFESHFGAIAQLGYTPSAHEFEISRSKLKMILSGIITRLQLNLSKKVFFSLISANVLPRNIISERGDKKNTIIHFHNWFNLTNQKEITRWAKRGYKVVVTMHDQRMMTGGCHYAFACKGLYSSCKSCPGLPKLLSIFPSINLKRFANKLQPITGNITFVSPSRWLDSEAKNSYLLGKQKTVFIPNTLGSHQNFEYGLAPRLNQNSINIGIASMEPNSYIKGGDITSSLERSIRAQGIPITFHQMRDFQQNNSGIQMFWSKIDYLMVISRADNSPNVIHEAKLRGIPLIASKVGGITELLNPKIDVGLDLSDCNESDLLNVLISLIGKTVDPSLRRETQARSKEDSILSVEAHIKLYNNLFT